VKRKLLMGTVVIAMAIFGTTVANAGPVPPTVNVMTARSASTSSSAGDTLSGGCFFLADKVPVVTAGQFQGAIGDASVSRAPGGAPTLAAVTCSIRVNGVTQAGTTYTYPTTGMSDVQTGANPMGFNAISGDTVTLCEHVVFQDGSTSDLCVAATEITDQPVIDLVGFVGGVIDPIVCPILSRLAGSYGLVTIGSDGDIFIDTPVSLRVYDCPPL
jgi:hypothetical protein